MKIKIGIPRALLYYDYYPLWKTFFKELGAEIVLSDKTNKTIINEGLSKCINEACLPMKVCHGHILNLLGKVDFIFLPRIKSVASYEYICPKFTGLPDMIKSSINNLPVIIDTEVDLRKDSNKLKDCFINAGNYITNDSKIIKQAAIKAIRENLNYREMLGNGKFPLEILDNYKSPKTNGLKIAVVGHVYNLYDSFVNNNLIKKLHDNNVEVITPEIVPARLVDENANKLNKKVFWSFARRIMGSCIYFTEKKNIDGMIYVMSFGCGIDSFIAELCERMLRRKTNIPFYLIVLDEHSGEAGLNTRIEAFLDMLEWRKLSESNISTYG